jgi:ABC-type oligopeptide transport system substrate-binding subunit
MWCRDWWGGKMKRVVLVVLCAMVLAVAALATVGAAPDSSAQSTGEPAPVLEDFEPSEELPADSAISFPVDI